MPQSEMRLALIEICLVFPSKFDVFWIPMTNVIALCDVTLV